MKNTQKSSYISFYTFYKKEVKRFMKVWGQTLLGPVVTSSLFLFIFSVAVGRNHEPDLGYTYLQFLVPGLIMMSIIQGSFACSSSSIIIAKLNGNIVDVFMAPISTSATIIGYTLGAVTRGLLIGFVIFVYGSLFSGYTMHNMLLAVVYMALAGSFLGLMGVIAGILSEKFDQLANFTTIFIVPMSFLSGTFYSTKALPEFFQNVVQLNPFFYMIDGLRYSFIGVSDASITTGLLTIIIANVILYSIAHTIWSKGYRIKS